MLPHRQGEEGMLPHRQGEEGMLSHRQGEEGMLPHIIWDCCHTYYKNVGNVTLDLKYS